LRRAVVADLSDAGCVGRAADGSPRVAARHLSPLGAARGAQGLSAARVGGDVRSALGDRRELSPGRAAPRVAGLARDGVARLQPLPGARSPGTASGGTAVA